MMETTIQIAKSKMMDIRPTDTADSCEHLAQDKRSSLLVGYVDLLHEEAEWALAELMPRGPNQDNGGVN